MNRRRLQVAIALAATIVLVLGVSASAFGSLESTCMYRFYNVRNGSHFFTADGSERDTIIATLGNTYQYEGVAYTIATPSQISGYVGGLLASVQNEVSALATRLTAEESKSADLETRLALAESRISNLQGRAGGSGFWPNTRYSMGTNLQLASYSFGSSVQPYWVCDVSVDGVAKPPNCGYAVFHFPFGDKKVVVTDNNLLTLNLTWAEYQYIRYSPAPIPVDYWFEWGGYQQAGSVSLPKSAQPWP